MIAFYQESLSNYFFFLFIYFFKSQYLFFSCIFLSTNLFRHKQMFDSGRASNFYYERNEKEMKLKPATSF